MPLVLSRLQLYPRWQPVAALSLVLIAGLAVGSAHAQTPFSPDRPGLGNGASIVPQGHLMVELGLPALEQEEYPSLSGSTRGWTASFPALVRVGLGNGWELRLGSPFYHIRRADDPDFEEADGFGDVELGAKIALPVPRPFFVTDVALLPTLTLPTGDLPDGTDRVGASLSAVGNWLGWWTIGFNTTSGVALVPVGDGYRLGGQFALSASHAPAPWLTLFAETAYFPVNDTDDTAYAGAGFTITPFSGLQLDAYVDAGLNDASTDYLYGAGIAFQL